MDILEVKREFSQNREQIEVIRGSLWLRKKKTKDRWVGKRDNERGILEW